MGEQEVATIALLDLNFINSTIYDRTSYSSLACYQELSQMKDFDLPDHSH
jgi:hypothetical protein